ncbi:MAG: chromate transporter, partial [Verrucomicrobiota bacterium]
AHLLPGPIAVNLVAWVGYRLRSTVGALISAASVILPSFILILVFSEAYFRYGDHPVTQRITDGFLIALAAAIAAVGAGMATKFVGSVSAGVIVIVSAAVLFVSSGKGLATIPLLILLGAGIGMARYGFAKKTEPEASDTVSASPRATSSESFHRQALRIVVLAALFLAAGIIALALPGESLFHLAGIFSGADMLLFGGAFISVPLFEEVLVQRLHWLGLDEFFEVTAFAQAMPGPNLISVAYVGWKLAGFLGALVATIAIFAPPAVIMILVSKATLRLKNHPLYRSAIETVRLVTIGLILGATWIVLRHCFQVEDALLTLSNLITAGLFALAFFGLCRLKWNLAWVVLGSGLATLVLHTFLPIS